MTENVVYFIDPIRNKWWLNDAMASEHYVGPYPSKFLKLIFVFLLIITSRIKENCFHYYFQ